MAPPPNRNDDFITGSSNPAITNEFDGIPGGKMVASIDSKDTLVEGLQGILNDLLKKVAEELAVAAAKAIVALII